MEPTTPIFLRATRARSQPQRLLEPNFGSCRARNIRERGPPRLKSTKPKCSTGYTRTRLARGRLRLQSARETQDMGFRPTGYRCGMLAPCEVTYGTSFR